MVVQLLVAVHLNEEDHVLPADELVEATADAFLELTSDNTTVDAIFHEEGLSGPDDIRILSGAVMSAELAIPPGQRGNQSL